MTVRAACTACAMDDKANALEIIRFGKPERVMEGCPSHGVAYLGCNHEGYAGGGHHLPVGSVWTDVWGTVWRRELEGVMGFPQFHPLDDLPRALRTYRWPDPDDERVCGRIREMARGWDRAKTFLHGSHRETLWEKAYMLVGMEDLMCFLHEEPSAVRELLHRIMDFDLAIARHYTEVGIEAAGLGDDLGTQQGSLFSREILHEFFVPEYRRLFDFYRSRGVIIHFHSCGNVRPVLDVLMDLGVNVLNPVQATANDLDEVRRVTQGRMALQGGVSSGVIVEGPIPRIRDEVRRRLWQLGRDGGYFCGPDQGMPWPEEHRKAVSEAVAEFGKYPLRPPS